jgi:hypothetical protein
VPQNVSQTEHDLSFRFAADFDSHCKITQRLFEFLEGGVPKKLAALKPACQLELAK